MDELLWLNKPLHLNKFHFFNLRDENNKHVFDYLELSMDDSIVAVKKSKVIDFLNDPEVRKIRTEQVKFPKKVEVKDEADFWKLLAIMIPVSEF